MLVAWMGAGLQCGAPRFRARRRLARFQVEGRGAISVRSVHYSKSIFFLFPFGYISPPIIRSVPCCAETKKEDVISHKTCRNHVSRRVAVCEQCAAVFTWHAVRICVVSSL